MKIIVNKSQLEALIPFIEKYFQNKYDDEFICKINVSLNETPYDSDKFFIDVSINPNWRNFDMYVMSTLIPLVKTQIAGDFKNFVGYSCIVKVDNNCQ